MKRTIILIFTILVLREIFCCNIHKVIDKEIKKSDYGVEIELNLKNKKTDKPVKYGRIELSFNKNRRFVFFADEKGNIRFSVSEYLYLNKKPRFKLKQNIGGDKVCFEIKIEQIMKKGGITYDYIKEYFLKYSEYTKLGKEIKAEDEIVIEHIPWLEKEELSYYSLVPHIKFFYQINEVKENPIILVSFSEFDAKEEEFMIIYPDKDFIFRFFSNNSALELNPKFFIYSPEFVREKESNVKYKWNYLMSGSESKITTDSKLISFLFPDPKINYYFME